MDPKGFLTYRVRSGYEDSLVRVCMYVCIYASMKFLRYLFISISGEITTNCKGVKRYYTAKTLGLPQPQFYVVPIASV